MLQRAVGVGSEALSLQDASLLSCKSLNIGAVEHGNFSGVVWLNAVGCGGVARNRTNDTCGFVGACILQRRQRLVHAVHHSLPRALINNLIPNIVDELRRCWRACRIHILGGVHASKRHGQAYDIGNIQVSGHTLGHGRHSA